MILLLIILIVYLFSNLLYTLFNEWVFDSQRAYMSLKELRTYKDMIVINGGGGGASIKFNYEWGIKFSPLTYWYYLYLCICDALKDMKYKKEHKITPPWRLK